VVSSAKVPATPQADPGSGVAALFVSIDPAANVFTVHVIRPVRDGIVGKKHPACRRAAADGPFPPDRGADARRDRSVLRPGIVR
jgi:hypothetical protein